MDVVQRFMHVADGGAARIAVHADHEGMTYAALATLARKFATLLSTMTSPRVLVAYDQGPYAYAAMLGTMLAGGCYAPVNVSAPRDKIAAIARSFAPVVVVGEKFILAGLEDTVPHALRVSTRDIESAEPLEGIGLRHSTAYVIFTSGSTGEPKGVVISHSALTHYMNWVVESRLFQPGDRTSQYTNIGFDLSVLDILGALCSGATVVPFVSRGDRLMPGEGIKKHGIAVWVSVPSVVSLMMRAKQLTAENLSGVRRFFLIGEPLLESHVAGLFAACPHAEVWNAYGPTEATVSMTCLKLTASTYASAVTTSVALGDAIPGMEVHIVGGESADTGELVIVGPQLADGYWNSPGQTSRAFRPVLIDAVQKRGYFSGDLVRSIGGHLYFQGRLDHQVKIDGFRLELSEVEAAIRSLGWAEVAVLKVQGEITAFVVHKAAGAPFNEHEIRRCLQQKLDRYAVPSRFFTLDEFPRNQNDKVDMTTLARLAEEHDG